MSQTAVTPSVAEERVKPLLRGVLHQAAFDVSLVVGTLIIIATEGTLRRTAVAIYAGSVAGLFGASALFHRVTWRPKARRWMRRLDHSMIFVLIAGTYTPITLIALSGTFSRVMFWVIWALAIAGIVLTIAWIDAPSWVTVGIYIGLGWMAALAFPQMWHRLGVAGFSLIAAGGLLYTGGAIVYARRRPDPVPHVFGYHEIFHTCVLLAAACHYVAVAFFVL